MQKGNIMRYLVLAVISVVVVFFVLNYRDKSEVNALKKEIEFHMEQVKAAKRQADSLEREMDLLVSHYVRLQASYRVATDNSLKWEKRYHDEKKRKTGILTDVAYDSIINGLYPR